MNIVLELLFVVLVIADLVLTYRVIKSGKGREVSFAKRYINNKWLSIFVTVMGILFILLLTAKSPWILILPIGAFGYACWHNWRILNG